MHGVWRQKNIMGFKMFKSNLDFLEWQCCRHHPTSNFDWFCRFRIHDRHHTKKVQPCQMSNHILMMLWAQCTTYQPPCHILLSYHDAVTSATEIHHPWAPGPRPQRVRHGGATALVWGWGNWSAAESPRATPWWTKCLGPSRWSSSSAEAQVSSSAT